MLDVGLGKLWQTVTQLAVLLFEKESSVRQAYLNSAYNRGKIHQVALIPHEDTLNGRLNMDDCRRYNTKFL